MRLGPEKGEQKAKEYRDGAKKGRSRSKPEDQLSVRVERGGREREGREEKGGACVTCGGGEAVNNVSSPASSIQELVRSLATTPSFIIIDPSPHPHHSHSPLGK